MKQILLVFLGGGLGSALRYFVAHKLNPLIADFYLGTFLVNILGCFIIGFVFGLSAKFNVLDKDITLVVATGFCGGFTTFSSFAYEQHLFVREGNFIGLLLYLLLSVITGILFVLLGAYLAKYV